MSLWLVSSLTLLCWAPISCLWPDKLIDLSNFLESRFVCIYLSVSYFRVKIWIHSNFIQSKWGTGWIIKIWIVGDRPIWRSYNFYGWFLLPNLVLWIMIAFWLHLGLKEWQLMLLVIFKMIEILICKNLINFQNCGVIELWYYGIPTHCMAILRSIF